MRGTREGVHDIGANLLNGMIRSDAFSKPSDSR
jgi:hypothetical protein